jgi:hypothetical protein
MLDVRKDRLDYGDMLIPPSGYRLARAIAATYTLDLNTLLSIPVALFFSQTMEGYFDAERIQLLEAIQRCPDVLKIYHQKGKIHVPKKRNRLYGLLEPCVVGILPDDVHTSFHPKVWVLRYEHDDQPVKYRVIILSRNLTYDQSWDIAVHLDGEVSDKRQSKNQPLVDFVEYLDQLESFEGAKPFIDDLRRVSFASPPGFDADYVFHPIGIGDYKNPIINQTGNRAICISPFVHDDAIATIRKNVTDDFLLFGCKEELNQLRPKTLSKVDAYCISSLIVDGELRESSDDGGNAQSEQNLHAKLYVYQDTSHATWFIGSANATKAAFDRNIEFLLELHGNTPQTKLDRLRKELLGEDGKSGVFEPYKSPVEWTDPKESKQLEGVLRRLEYSLLKNLLVKKAELLQSENGVNFDLHLSLDLESVTWSDLKVTVVPFNTDQLQPQALTPNSISNLVFANINESNLSQFIRIDIWQTADRLRSFLVKIDIAGLPPTRIGRILRSIIDNRDRFFDYLRFLLTDDLEKEMIGTEPIDRGSSQSERSSVWDTTSPIYEQLLVAASRYPNRLKAIDSIIEQIRNDDSTTDNIIPQEFLDFWESFKEIVATTNRKKRK